MVVDLNDGKPGKKLAIQADFDALAIVEDNDLPFQSKSRGVMHACGHDAHRAYLMVLARELNKIKDEIPGSIRIIHQPDEEVAPGGAKGMIADGALADVDDIIGVHVMTSMDTGVGHNRISWCFIGFHERSRYAKLSTFVIHVIQ